MLAHIRYTLQSFKLINFHLQTTLRLFVLLLLSLPNMPSGLWHYEFITQLLQGLYKNANKLPSRHARTPPTSRGHVFENLLVGDWPILCGREQAFQGPPRTSQHIAACQSSTAKNSFQGPRSATCGGVGHTTLKTPRTIPWYVRTSAEPIGRPVWLLAEAASAG